MFDTTHAQRTKHVEALLARCEHLHAIAVAVLQDSSTRGTCGAGESLAAHAQSRALCEQFAQTPGTDNHAQLTTLAPGLHAAKLSLRDEVGVFATFVVLFPQRSAFEMDGCMRHWLGDAACGQLARWDDTSARATAHALVRWADDLGHMSHSEVDTVTFTQQLTSAFDTIDLMYQLGRSMKQPSLPEHFLTSMCERVRTTLSFGWMVASFDDAQHVPKSLRSQIYSHGELPRDVSQLQTTARGLVAHASLQAGPLASLPGVCATQVAVQPLDHKGQRVGVLIVGAKFGDDPDVSSYDTQLLEATSGFLGSFIDNVALYDDQDDLFMGTVQAMTAAIDAKDHYTCGHSERVALLSFMIAKAAGLSQEMCNDARIGGLVHDVGKIGVPEWVLCKPGKLTDEEFGHIKKHPEIGYRILKGVKLLASVLPGVMHHHERWDGRGYPHKIAGEQIPLLARVIAVADTFDAMSSDRSYRKKLAREDVLAEIVRSGGTQLDPALAPLILQVDLTAYDAMAHKHAEDHAPVIIAAPPSQTSQAA
jgi:HD-GYP domain-containing protein (c-di-GMP phosphodiesterase class II)